MTRRPFLQAHPRTPSYTLDFRGSIAVTASDFGAVGDGLTDDTAAIQEAIETIGLLRVRGKKRRKRTRLVVELAPGTFRVTSPLSVPPRLTVQGTRL